jgi:hypothetical protein
MLNSEIIENPSSVGGGQLSFCSSEIGFFYIVSAYFNESEIEFLDLFRGVFELEVYTNSEVFACDLGRFQFSKMYPYSVFAFNLVAESQTQYFTFFYLISNLVNSNFCGMEGFDFQVQDDFERAQFELEELSAFFYFVGFGSDRLVPYSEFCKFVQFLISATPRVGPSVGVTLVLLRNLCLLPFLLKKFRLSYFGSLFQCCCKLY